MSRQSKSGLIKSTSKWKAYTYSLGIFVLSFMTAFLAASVFNSPNNTNAEEGDNTSSASASGYNLSVSATSNVNLDLSVSDNDTMTVRQGSVVVSTTSPGYKLYMSMLSDNTNLSSTTVSGVIAATSGTFSTPSALTRGTWGYAIPSGTSHIASNGFNATYSEMSSSTPNNSATFAIPPIASSNPQLIASSTSATTGDTYPIYYGIRANSSTNPGVYSNNIAFTAVADAGTNSKLKLSQNILNKDATATITVETPLYTTADYADASVYFLTKSQYDSISGTNVEATGGTLLSCSKTSATPVTYSCTIPASLSANYGDYYIYAKFPKYDVTYSSEFYVINNAVKFFTAVNMQDFADSTFCSSATTPNASATQADTTGEHAGDPAYVPQRILSDIRDGETYTVRKLADEHCWMTENLRLGDPTKEITLTPADSNVAENFVLPVGETATQSLHWTMDSSHVFTKDEETFGARYNFYTAVAGSQTSTTTTNSIHSICPKGFVLPSTENYANLLSAYNISEMFASGAAAASAVFNNAVLAFPLEFDFTGTFSYGNFVLTRRVVYFTTTAFYGSSADNYKMVTVFFISDVSEYKVISRYFGLWKDEPYSIRCLAQ